MRCNNQNCPNGLLGSEPPYTDVRPVSSLADMCTCGTFWGWRDGYTGLVRDHRLELHLRNPEKVASYSYDQLMAYGDCYVAGYNQGVAERNAATPPPAQPYPEQPPAPDDPGTGTLVCDVINIQTALNRLGANIDVDGDWGPATQAAYAASGKTCAELVPSCTACPGTYTPGTSTPGTKTPGTTPGTTPVGYEQPAKKASPWPWLLGGLAVAGIAGLAYFSLSGPKENPIGGKPARSEVDALLASMAKYLDVSGAPIKIQQRHYDAWMRKLNALQHKYPGVDFTSPQVMAEMQSRAQKLRKGFAGPGCSF